MNDFEVHPIGTAQRLTELERDAARYRWLKSKSGFGVKRNQVIQLSIMLGYYPSSIDELDAAIDAAMEQYK